jgi:hypothetical protein
MAEVVSESVNEPAPEKTVRQLRDELLEKIAKKELFIDTLETQRSDSLDFHDRSVQSIKAALEAAFLAGVEVGASVMVKKI